MLYGVKPADPLTFAAVAVVLFVAALAASWVPGRRATRVSPLDALRSEYSGSPDLMSSRCPKTR
jgi:hypothetical protein